MSKLKVALSKFPNLPIKIRPLVGSRYTLLEARAMAAKFYREKLPKMTTIPKQIDSPPKLNVWLWIVGYLRVNWSDVEKNLTRSGRFLNLKRSLTLLSKLKCPDFAVAENQRSTGFTYSVQTEEDVKTLRDGYLHNLEQSHKTAQATENFSMMPGKKIVSWFAYSFE
ncbi:hypothetical protein RUM44_000533 [Polyplax serrata]|uniref:Homing endonuclease LAGLIDADG domain-containing protein n=1 Tax=Polyplax serrata TaxID=468196 RepID=A0ABR1B6T4_POLSC